MLLFWFLFLNESIFKSVSYQTADRFLNLWTIDWTINSIHSNVFFCFLYLNVSIKNWSPNIVVGFRWCGFYFKFATIPKKWSSVNELFNKYESVWLATQLDSSKRHVILFLVFLQIKDKSHMYCNKYVEVLVFVFIIWT